MKNIRIRLAYDGTLYLGWQKTRHGKSIEESLEKTLQQILQHKITLQAASRTDAGVHAKDQVVNFFTDKELDLSQLHLSLNQLLPKTIRVKNLEIMGKNFHPTLDALGKIYRYKICNNPDISPFEHTTTWHYPKKLCCQKINQAKNYLIGKNDFQGFSNVRKPAHKSTICTIYSIDLIEKDGYLDFLIKGDHFLYKMVRNIVGTLVYIGADKLNESDLENIFTLQCRTLAGVTAPPEGLFLEKVIYSHAEL